MPRLSPAALILGLAPAAGFPADPAVLPGTTVPLAGPMPAMVVNPLPVSPTVGMPVVGPPTLLDKFAGLFGPKLPACPTCGTGGCVTPAAATAPIRPAAAGKPAVQVADYQPAPAAAPVVVHPAPAPAAVVVGTPVAGCPAGGCPTVACPPAGCGGHRDRSCWAAFKQWICWRPSPGSGLPVFQPAPYQAPVLAYFRDCREPNINGGCGGPACVGVGGVPTGVPGVAVAANGQPGRTTAPLAATPVSRTKPADPNAATRPPVALPPGMRFAAPEPAPKGVVPPAAQAGTVTRPFTNP